MNTENQEIHIHGLVQGLVVGTGNSITLVYQSGEKRTVPFLAPPQPPYDLIGRDDLLRDLKAKLLAGKNLALSALNGLPGIGKTALAVALAYDPQVLSHFSDGILWAGLGRDASETNVLSILSLWGTALGVPPNEMEKLPDVKARRERIQATIGQRSILLVIDDAWKIELAWQLKVGGPNCAYLLTTRVPEVATRYAHEGMIVVHELSEEDSLLLLRWLAPSVMDAEIEAAQRLVQAVGRLPLALTLMGNYLRVQALSEQPYRLREALDRLKQARERLKVEEPQGELGYHPSLPVSNPLSLQIVIAVSDEALDESARQMLRAISVFPAKPNTFSKEAALAVSLLPVDTLDMLIDFGLLESGGAGRYTFHQTISDYARINRTDPEVEKRMAKYFVNYVEQHETDYEVLEPEATNVHEALQIALQQEMHEALMRGTNTFCPFLESRGAYQAAKGYLEQALAIARSPAESNLLISTLLNLGKIAGKEGRYGEAVGFLQEGLSLARAHYNPETLSALLQQLGNIAGTQGDYSQALTYFQEGLTLARQLAHDERVSAFLTNIGTIMGFQGNNAQAQSFWEEGLQLARKIGHKERIVTLLINFGATANNQGDYSQAKNYYEEGLALARQIGHRERISFLLRDLGEILISQGRYTDAEASLQEGLEIARQIKHRELISSLLRNVGRVKTKQGNYTQAEHYLREGLEIEAQLGHPAIHGFLLQSLAEVANNRGDYTQANIYLQQGLEIARQLNYPELTISLLQTLSEAEISKGNYTQADAYLQEGLTNLHEVNLEVTSDILQRRGNLHLKMQQPDKAIAELEEALEIASKENYELTALVRFGLAQALAQQGNSIEALHQGEISLSLLETIGHKDARHVKTWLKGLSTKSD